MNNKARYNYFNLLVRSTIGIVALWFIYFKLKDTYFLQLNAINLGDINFYTIILAFLLSFINWGIETVKWKYSLKRVCQINFIDAYKIVLSSITMSLVTPNRVGEIPSRAYLLNNNEQLNQTIYATFITSFSQLLITVLFGVMGLFFTIDLFGIYLSVQLLNILVVGTLLLFLIFFYSNTLKKYVLKIFKRDSSIEFTGIDYLMILFYSFVRYSIFVVQFYLILYSFGLYFNEMSTMWLIPVCFFIASSIPTFLISELGVRSSVAVIVFGVVMNNDVVLILSSITLWFINVGLPAVYGIGFLKRLKISN